MRYIFALLRSSPVAIVQEDDFRRMHSGGPKALFPPYTFRKPCWKQLRSSASRSTPSEGAPPTVCPRPTLQGPPYHAGRLPRFWTLDGFLRGVRRNGSRGPPGPDRPVPPGVRRNIRRPLAALEPGTFPMAHFRWPLLAASSLQPCCSRDSTGDQVPVECAAVHDFGRLLIAR